jgi:hypothetical protein
MRLMKMRMTTRRKMRVMMMMMRRRRGWTRNFDSETLMRFH